MLPSSAFIEYEVTTRQRRVREDVARRRTADLAVAPSRSPRRPATALRRRAGRTVGACEPAPG